MASSSCSPPIAAAAAAVAAAATARTTTTTTHHHRARPLRTRGGRRARCSVCRPSRPEKEATVTGDARSHELALRGLFIYWKIKWPGLEPTASYILDSLAPPPWLSCGSVRSAPRWPRPQPSLPRVGSVADLPLPRACLALPTVPPALRSCAPRCPRSTAAALARTRAAPGPPVACRGPHSRRRCGKAAPDECRCSSTRAEHAAAARREDAGFVRERCFR
jgi:hypothetical protein